MEKQNGYYSYFTMYLYGEQLGCDEFEENYYTMDRGFVGENLPTTLFFFSATQVNE